MRLQLPFAFEVNYRVHRGRKTYRRIHRAQVEVELAEIGKADLEEAILASDSTRQHYTYASPRGLVRPITFAGRPLPAREIEFFTNPIMIGRGPPWSKEEFPRPQYLRSAAYRDLSAVDWPDESQIPPRLRWLDSKRETARSEAKAAYENLLFVVEGNLWTRVPEPVWLLSPYRRGSWQIEVVSQPTIWDAALSFSINNFEKAEWFAEELHLDVEENCHTVRFASAFSSRRSDLTALASATIALARRQLLPVQPDECVSGEQSLALVENAILAAGGRDHFPWAAGFTGDFAVGVRPRQLRHRWRFELGLPEHRSFKDALWSEDPAICERARLDIAGRPLAHVDLVHLSAEDELALLTL